MTTIERVAGVYTGKISELAPLDPSKQCHLLTALARGAEELSSGKGWPDGAPELIADLGQIMGVSRVWLFQVLELSDKHMLMNFPFEWVDGQTRALKKNPRYDTKRWNFDTCSTTYRTLIESRMRREWQTVIIDELDDCDFKDYQVTQGVQSTVSIPVMVQGQWWGLLGLDDCTRPYQWSAEDIALLRMTAQLISSAVMRNRLNSTNRQFKILSNLTESSAWELDIASGYCWCNSKIISHVKGVSDNIHLPLLQALRHIHPEDMSEAIRHLRKQIKNGDLNFRKDLRIRRDNEYVWSEVIARVSLNENGRLRKMAGIIIDIPERKEKEERLYREATLDPLTGIANRGSFDNHFNQIIQGLQEEGKVFSLLLLDIDHFKKVNDSWGHDVGDQALKHVTRIMKNTLRESDFAARFGGEEFAILLHGDATYTSEIVAERIRCNIEQSPLFTSKATVPLTVSIGIFNSSKRSSGLDDKAILKKADKALYHAKSNGRNKVVIS